MARATMRLDRLEEVFRRHHHLYTQQELEEVVQEFVNALHRAIAPMELSAEESFALRQDIVRRFDVEIRKTKSPVLRREVLFSREEGL